MSINKNNKIYFKIILIIAIFFRGVCLLSNKVLLLNLFIFSINQTTINFILNVLIIISIAWGFNLKDKKAVRIFLKFIAMIFIALLALIWIFFNSEKRYFYFTSPDGSNTLVVEEKSFLLAGGSSFYQRNNHILVNELNEFITTDDGYRPFSDNHYEVKWLDNKTVELHYDYGSGEAAYHIKVIKLN